MLIDPAAIAALRDGQRQLDADGVEVGVSRQALDMLLDWHDDTPRPFNGLTPAEDERLSMLAEEAAEVIVAVEKIKRHGYERVNPDHPGAGNNRGMLADELVYLLAVALRMSEIEDIFLGKIFAPSIHLRIEAAWRLKLQYSHHQGAVR